MEHEIATTDYGQTIPLRLHVKGGEALSAADLGSAAYRLTVYRRDSIRSPMQPLANDTKIVPADKRRIHYYRVNDVILVGDEPMTVTAVDLSDGTLTVTRDARPIRHDRGEPINHIVVSSATAVEWNGVYGRVELKPEAGWGLEKGAYFFEVEVETATALYNSLESSPGRYHKLRVVPDANRGA